MIVPFVGAWFFVPNLRILLPINFDISEKQQSQTGVCCICVCPQIIIPSGKSILLLGIFMPFWGCKRRTIT